MGKMIRTICSEAVVIYSPLPVERLLSMEVQQVENEHGRMRIKIIAADPVGELGHYPYQAERIKICVCNQGQEEVLFDGRIARVVFEQHPGLLTAEVSGITDTVELDQEPRRRSFQDPAMTYQQVVEQITGAAGARYIWMPEDCPIKEPLLQYDETDWEFLQRLASHFETSVTAELTTGRADFWFGIRSGQERQPAAGQILESGFSRQYYQQGGYQQGYSRSRNMYLKIKSREVWGIGDYLRWEGGSYTVCQGEARFEQGALCFFYTLGTDRMLYQPKLYQKALRGLRLKGTVERTERESVYLSLDIDEQQNADYPWPWVPETGNLSYCMPEEGTQVVLYLPTDREADGIVIHGIRENGAGSFYEDVRNREFLTGYGKKVGMYAEELLFETKDGISGISLEDHQGIWLGSEGGVQLLAEQDVTVKGQEIAVTAPRRIVCQTGRSNLEICRNFNLYAPGGVKSKGINEEITVMSADKEEAAGEIIQPAPEPVHWQVSLTALGAVPAGQGSSDSPDQPAARAACGALPRFGEGTSIIAAAEVMAGKKVQETTFPFAFQAMQSYSLKGGYLLPPEETGE